MSEAQKFTIEVSGCFSCGGEVTGFWATTRALEYPGEHAIVKHRLCWQCMSEISRMPPPIRVAWEDEYERKLRSVCIPQGGAQ